MEDPKKVKARKKRWSLRNPDYGKHWRLANPEKARAISRRRYLKTKFALALYWQLYRLAFPERCRIVFARRRARLRKATIGDKRSIDRVYERAQQLRRWFDVSVDHVTPLSRGGSHSADNLQIIYSSDNFRKNDRMGYKPSVIFA